MDPEGVAVGIGEVGLMALAAVDDVGLKLDAARLELGLRPASERSEVGSSTRSTIAAVDATNSRPSFSAGMNASVVSPVSISRPKSGP